MPPRTEADRARAYEDLAVANVSPPLEASEVGYLELVSSPDPRVAPMVFVLEHVKVRLGRFTLAGTYATSPDVFVAVADEATAIAPMNTMFEHLDGRFHAFDTRSVNGTFVNGEQIRRRRALVPGDVIDLGGAPADGGARIVFLGTTAPAGRPLRRAPQLTRHGYQTPRGGLELEVDSATGTGLARLQFRAEDWLAAAVTLAARVGRVGSAVLPRSTPGAEPATVHYVAGESLQAIPGRRVLDDRTARSIVADLCDAAAACHRANPPIVLGPFDRRLVFVRASGRAALFGAGLTRLAYEHDAGSRGAMMLARHFARSPEELQGTPTGPATDAWFAAAFLVSLGNGGYEPFPTEDEGEYFDAVTRGQPILPAHTPPAIVRAFSPDPRARPTLAALAGALRD